MSDRPWLEGGDPALRAERELLKRLNAEQPPAGSVEHGWAALAAEISNLPPVEPGLTSGPTQVAPHAAATSGASTGLVAKALLGVALAGGAWWGGSALWSKEEAPTAPVRPALVPSERAADAAPSFTAELAPAPASPEPSVNATERLLPPRGATATTLAEEGKLLAEAHRLVQSGQPQRALTVLRASQSRYPRSVLAQEREVLTIEALYASGSSGAARQRAQQFMKRHPKSPHAERLQRFVE